jgi:hypothetical protein
LVADVMSEKSWSAATPRRHLARRDEGCPLVLRYAVWRENIACASFRSGYAEVIGCEFVKGACRGVRQSFFSSFPVIPKASLGERKTQLNRPSPPGTSLAVAYGGNCVADAEIPP